MTRLRNMHGWHLSDRYDVRKRIGFGAYGSVRQAFDRDKDRTVAIKRQIDVFRHPVDSRRILREVAILTRLSHVCVVQLYDIYVDGEPSDFNVLYCAMEACDTDMRHMLRRNLRLEIRPIHDMMYSLLIGLKYIHSAGIYHRDLKPANCLVNEDYSLKICDFGFARTVVTNRQCRQQMPTEDCRPRAARSHLFTEGCGCEGYLSPCARRTLTGRVGTRWYRAPELILLQRYYTEKVDVWSAGCIYAEILQLLPDGPSCESRLALFPGMSCDPLSPKAGHGDDDEQLNQIFKILGTPSVMDVNALESESSRRYARRFATCSGIGLHNLFHYAPKDAQQLLEEMLAFNPQARICVDLALEHALFKGVRDIRKERVSTGQIVFDFESDDEPDEDFLQEVFAREIDSFHSKGKTGTEHSEEAEASDRCLNAMSASASCEARDYDKCNELRLGKKRCLLSWPEDRLEQHASKERRREPRQPIRSLWWIARIANLTESLNKHLTLCCMPTDGYSIK